MPVPSDTKPDETKPADPKPADGTKVMKEFWPNGKLKYYNEMRRNAAGKWMKNGVGRAYYDHGVLEREGTYKDDVRVGQWKYYDQEGKLSRTEERGDGVAH
jgi:antitoxin component YwqK of YwqJK toxin-antitoxin module